MNLTVVVTGAVSASFLPYWANWLHMFRPDVSAHYLVTPSAQKFVSPDSIRAVSGGPVDSDSWDGLTDPLHVRLVDWSDGMLAYPATLHYVAQVALGTVNAPSLLAHACSDAPLVLAPALPPGAIDQEIYRVHRQTLSNRSNVTVVDPHPTRSSAATATPAYGAAPMNECLVHFDDEEAA